MARDRSTPDVTVVVPVYNAMPYLTHCLASLARQSIGRERMRVVAVDDGSTDGSGRELDRFARRHPDTVEIVRQANSGGPAAPCNRGLERATGRYVFFLGADDHLGREALERLVAAADRLGSDVVLGRAVGVNGRFVHQEVFAADRIDIDLYDSALPWSLANTKLFRRELIERLALRYREDMPQCSDQPFTISACVHARRISVLADYDYYFAVRRLGGGNITYAGRVEERLRCVASIVEHVAALVPAGPKRDAVLTRHFALELAGFLGDDFRRLDRVTQERVHDGVGRLAERYLTPGITGRLGVEARLRLGITRRGTVDDLLGVIRQDADDGVPPTVVVGGRWYAGYPGVDSGPAAGSGECSPAAGSGEHSPAAGSGPSRPDSRFDVTDAAAGWIAKLDATAVSWEAGDGHGRVLTITARSPRADLPELTATPIHLAAGDVPGTTLTTAGDSSGTTVRARFPVGELVAHSAASGQRHVVRTQVSAFGAMAVAPLRGPRLRRTLPRLWLRGIRLFAVSPAVDRSGHLVISVVPVTVARVLARLRRHAA